MQIVDWLFPTQSSNTDVFGLVHRATTNKKCQHRRFLQVGPLNIFLSNSYFTIKTTADYIQYWWAVVQRFTSSRRKWRCLGMGLNKQRSFSSRIDLPTLKWFYPLLMVAPTPSFLFCCLPWGFAPFSPIKGVCPQSRLVDVVMMLRKALWDKLSVYKLTKTPNLSLQSSSATTISGVLCFKVHFVGWTIRQTYSVGNWTLQRKQRHDDT